MMRQLLCGFISSELTKFLVFTKGQDSFINPLNDPDEYEIDKVFWNKVEETLYRQLVFWCPNLIVFLCGDADTEDNFIEINLATEFSDDPNADIEIDPSMQFIIEVPLEITESETLTIHNLGEWSFQPLHDVRPGYYRLITEEKEVTPEDINEIEELRHRKLRSGRGWFMETLLYRFTLIPVSEMPRPRYHKFGRTVGSHPRGLEYPQLEMSPQ